MGTELARIFLTFIMPFLLLGGIVWAVWLGFKLANSENEGKRKQARQHLFNGVSSVLIIVILFSLLAGIVLYMDSDGDNGGRPGVIPIPPNLVGTSGSGVLHGGTAFRSTDLAGPNSPGGGVVSAMATCNATGARGFVTANHVIPECHPVARCLTSNNVIGVRDRGQTRGRVHAAFVPFMNPDQWVWNSSSFVATDQVVPRVYLPPNERFIQRGLSVVLFGHGVDGGRSSEGEIRNTRQVIVAGTGTLTGQATITQIRSSTPTRPGDSGAPVFHRDAQGRYILIGINGHGQLGYGYSSCIFEVKLALNVTIFAERLPT